MAVTALTEIASKQKALDTMVKRAEKNPRLWDVIDREFPHYNNPPEIHGIEQWYIIHFMELGSERRVEGGFIPVLSIHLYGKEILDLHGRELKSFCNVMRELDKEVLNKEHDKRKKNEAKQKHSQVNKANKAKKSKKIG